MTGTPAWRSSSSSVGVRAGAEHDRVDHPAEHLRRVLDRLAAPELHVARREHRSPCRPGGRCRSRTTPGSASTGARRPAPRPSRRAAGASRRGPSRAGARRVEDRRHGLGLVVAQRQERAPAQGGVGGEGRVRHGRAVYPRAPRAAGAVRRRDRSPPSNPRGHDAPLRDAITRRSKSRRRRGGGPCSSPSPSPSRGPGARRRHVGLGASRAVARRCRSAVRGWPPPRSSRLPQPPWPRAATAPTAPPWPLGLAAFVAAGVAVGAGHRAQERAAARIATQSLVDRLTGVHNYAFFEDALPRECRRAERYGRPLSLILLDLDRFKAFNDRHGHDAGNRLLAAVGDDDPARTRARRTSPRASAARSSR